MAGSSSSFPGLSTPVPMKRRRLLCSEDSGWFTGIISVDDYAEDGGVEDIGGSGGNVGETDHPRWRAQPQKAGLAMETMIWSDCWAFKPDIPIFKSTPGSIMPDFPCDSNSKEMDYFCAFLDEDMANSICEQSNRYQALSVEYGNVPKSTKMRKWSPLKVPEYYVFMALLLLMAHVKKHVLKEYWITNDLVSTPAFGKYMARDRFVEILRFLHFADNPNPVESDKLGKIRPFFHKIRDKFIKFVWPFQNVCVDESLLLFKGRVVFRQYIPYKRRCFGMKFFVICDSDSGYILDIVIYSGSDVDFDSGDPLAFSGMAVKELVDRYFGGNHMLYSEHFSTPPALTKYLLEHDTGSRGILKANEKHWPKVSDKHQLYTMQLQKAERMLAIRWIDNRPAVNISDVAHASHLVEAQRQQPGSVEKVKKPDITNDTAMKMKLADESVMQVSDVECVRKCLKWHKKIFLLLIDLTMLNSYKLYMAKTGKHPSLREFSKRVIEQLLQKYHTPRPSVPRRYHENKPMRLQCQDYISKHHIVPNPGKQRRRCYVCYHSKRTKSTEKRSLYQCKECQVSLCVLPCFMEYHTLKDF